jgi:hypothetical protein
VPVRGFAARVRRQQRPHDQEGDRGSRLLFERRRALARGPRTWRRWPTLRIARALLQDAEWPRFGGARTVMARPRRTSGSSGRRWSSRSARPSRARSRPEASDAHRIDGGIRPPPSIGRPTSPRDLSSICRIGDDTAFRARWTGGACTALVDRALRSRSRPMKRWISRFSSIATAALLDRVQRQRRADGRLLLRHARVGGPAHQLRGHRVRADPARALVQAGPLAHERAPSGRCSRGARRCSST